MLDKITAVFVQTSPYIVTPEARNTLLQTFADACTNLIVSGKVSDSDVRSIAYTAKTFGDGASISYPALFTAISDWLCASNAVIEVSDLGGLLAGFSRPEYRMLPALEQLQSQLVRDIHQIRPRMLSKLACTTAALPRPNHQLVRLLADEILLKCRAPDEVCVTMSH